MWIHTNILHLAKHLPDGVDFATETETAGSLTHVCKVRVHLTGTNTRKANSGTHGGAYYQAATYDEWGWFLASLFEEDPTAKCDYYKSRDDFHTKTKNKYRI